MDQIAFAARAGLSHFELEGARCPRCGGAPGRVVRRGRCWLLPVPGVYDVRSCAGCGLWMTSPRPTRTSIASAYPQAYYERSRPDEGLGAAPGAPLGRLLDVGCGTGEMMARDRAAGWAVTGIEMSEAAAEVARLHGLEVIVGEATEAIYPPEKFDRVRCWHTLEHVHDPLLLLRRIREACTPRGEVSLVVPNPRSATALLFGNGWYHLDVPRHLHHFRPADIRALASRAGLGVERERHTASPSGVLGSIDIAVLRAGGRDPRLRARPSLRSLSRMLTWPTAWVRLADVVEYTLVPSG